MSRIDEIELHEPLTEATKPPTLPDRSSTLTKYQIGALFLTHFLSTWHIRTYEFAAILFTAVAFPDTLFYSSLRACATTLAALLFCSRIHDLIDISTNRQIPLLLSISINHISVITACFVWLLLLYDIHDVDKREIWPESRRWWLFAVVTFIGLFQNLSGMANSISIERDWIPVLSDPSFSSPFPVFTLNAGMTCIDLICKIFAPLFISLIAFKLSYRNSVLLIANISLISWGFEMLAANRVWRWNSRLQSSKLIPSRQSSSKTAQPQTLVKGGSSRNNIRSSITKTVYRQISQFNEYFSSELWIPSLTLAFLHVSVLSYAATFTTFMLNSGYSVLVIAVAKAISSIVEVCGTLGARVSVRLLAGTTRGTFDLDSPQTTPLAEQGMEHGEWSQGVGLTRTGLWAILMQLASLGPIVYGLFRLQGLQLSDVDGDLHATGMVESYRNVMSIPSGSILETILIFVFISVSSLGLSVFDSSIRGLTQVKLAQSQRSSFKDTEMLFVCFFELCQWLFVAVFSDPQEFLVLAVGSIGAVGMSAMIYAGWVRKQAGNPSERVK